MLMTPHPCIGLHQIGNIQHRFAEDPVTPLTFQGQQTALDGADTGSGDIAVFGRERFGIVADKLQHGPQVLQVQQEQAVVISHLENQVENAALGLVQLQHPRQQQGSHIGHGGTHRMS